MAKITARFEMIDKVSKKLKVLSGNLEGLNKRKRSLEKPMHMKVRDEATKKLRTISREADKTTKRRRVTMEVMDKITRPMNQIKTFLRRRMPRSYSIAVEAKDRATRAIYNIKTYADRALAKGYNFSVRAIDIASKTVGRIASYTGKSIPAVRNFTIGAIDRATRVVGAVKRALFSIPTMITVGLAVVGMSGLGKSTVGSAMRFEDYGVSMGHWLEGDQKASDQLMDWMGKKADTTPYTSADIFPAMTGAVSLAGNNLKDIQRLTSIAIDMAALTPGRSVEDAMQAIQNAHMGELTMMKGFGLHMTKEEMDSLGWKGFTAEIEKRFQGGALALSETGRGQLNTLSGYMQSQFRSMGDGILEAMKPRLQGITQWLLDNEESWGRWKSTVQQTASEGAEWALTKLEGAFSYIQNNYLENDEFKNLDFEGKVKFIMSDLGDWWDKTGLPWVTEVGILLGKSITKGVIWGIKEGIKGIGSMWANAFKDPSIGGFATAGVATAVGASIISLITKPLINAFKIGKAILWDAPKWVYNLFSGGRGKGIGGDRRAGSSRKRSRAIKLPKIPRGLSKFANLGKRIPVLGTVLGGLSLLGAQKGERAGIAGGIGGGLAGASAGAAIGSIIPGIGTAVGGVVGGIAGGFGGEALVGWLGDNWDTIKSKASEAGQWISNTFTNVKDSISSTIFSGEWWSEKWNSVKNTAINTIFSADWWVEQAGFIYGYLESTLFSGEWWLEKWGHVSEWTAEKWESAVEIWESVKTSFAETVFNSDWWYEKWQGVQDWTSEKWNQAQEIWSSVLTSIGETIFNGEWWLGKWDGVKGWAADKWDEATEIWESARDILGSTLFDSDWWSGQWDDVLELGKGILGGIGGFISRTWGNVTSSFQSGREKGQQAAEYADGGIINRPHLGLVGEAGPEAIIPLSANRRGRALDLYEQTGRALGVQPYARGGIVGRSVPLPSAQPVDANISISGISAQGIDKEALNYGQAFSETVAEGINNKVVSLDAWKRRNIETPMQQVVQEAVGFGTSTVTSFTSGQNATPTHTKAYLDQQVKHPFQVIQGGASQWGSRTMSEYVSGMRSKEAQVKDASKYLAKQVEKTFREELGIASPSQVMMKHGMWTAMGIVKGLSSVDIKGFAEKQAGSLAAAFSNMGSIGGNVRDWIAAAMMITGVPASWLGPLSVIAQHESGGNPRAINLWDINAQRGIPSKGLMQTIDPTFNAYKGKGMNDIYNPIHNAVAAINYIKSRYGNVFNVPGIRSMARGGAYRGYWRGTTGALTQSETAWVGEKGPELVTLPRGAQVHSYYDSKRMINDTLSEDQVQIVRSAGTERTTVGQSRGLVVHLNFTGDNHYSNEMDAEKVGKIAVDAVNKYVEEAYNETGEVVIDD